MAKTTSYWRLRLSGTPMGLFRRTDEGGLPVELAFLGVDGWVEDPTLLKWWLDPGDRDLYEVGREEAEGVALASGVELGAEAR